MSGNGATGRGRLVVLSGPSCVGKSPLAKALGRFYPEEVARLKPVVLYNARAPRPGEVDGVDYHFRAREEIESMRGREGMLVLDVRGDLQALDLVELGAMLDGGENAFFEGNPFVGGALVDEAGKTGTPCLGIFVTPLAGEELRHLASSPGVELEKLVTDVMRQKLLRRTRRQKGEMSLKDLEEVERRAGSAFREMKEGRRFAHVIPNHDGEDSENWDAFYHPLGDARRTMLAVAALLRGEEAPPWVEDWSAGWPGGEES